ncbi:tail fiber protein [Candidatus Pacearchaeota archaeon]|nr:tail fiber protein [Candidatus Pacearchaeota archaeon]
MSKQTVKDVIGVGRSIVKEITTIERATPSIIYFEGRLQGLEQDMVDNFAIDSTQDDRITILEGVEVTTGLPAGSVIAWGGLIAPPGYMECDGRLTTQAINPELYAAIGDSFNTGGEVGDQFRVPNLQGEFIRGWDNGRGVDSGRVFGSFQDHLIESHRHFQDGLNLSRGGSVAWYNWELGPAGTGTIEPYTGNTGGSETRPRNLAMMYCIKAFDAIVDQGTVDITALSNQVALNTSDISQNTSDISDLDSSALLPTDFPSVQGTQGWQELAGGLILEWGFKARPILTNGGATWLSAGGNVAIAGWQRLERILFTKITTPLFVQTEFESESYTAADHMWPSLVVSKNSNGFALKAAEPGGNLQDLTGISWYAIGY